MVTVAALYVATGGCYFGLDYVIPYDESRDARQYAGPHPVVAHPPCARWCRLAGLVEARWGHKRGEDGGCFAAALASVRRWGGVLEHPAYSDAFAAHGIPSPVGRGWQRTIDGGAVAHVDQCHFGHRARKATWLYAFGAELPQLPRGRASSSMWLPWCDNHSSGKVVERMGKVERNATPLPFRDLLLSIARSSSSVSR